ncbi:hypothetical protein [Thalassotalea aquiviva]|uniref:hypothetical protein n=1 Tax=Thalassotalea aquiviva TaxID=3242415 RepID=UPI00352AC330
MKQHVYLADDLGDLQLICQQLEQKGFSKPQLHLIGNRQGVRYLESLLPSGSYFIGSMFRREINTIIALLVTIAIASAGYILNLTLPMLISLVLFCFAFIFFILTSINKYPLASSEKTLNCTRLNKQLKQGRFILLIDHTEQQEALIENVITEHPHIENVGVYEF